MRGNAVLNLPASIHQKLLNIAKRTNRPFTEVLRYYTLERYLYRLARSPFADKFVLKGALMFAVWKAPRSRSTKDIDLLGRMENDVDTLVRIAKTICRQAVEPDGVQFDETSVVGERIIEEAEYSGVRIKISGTLGTSRLGLQTDIAFGDDVYPAPTTITFPTLIGSPAPRLRGYSRESVIAEKYHIMFDRGMLNSRLKDYYDVWLLIRQYDFDGKTIAQAIQHTFKKRGASLAERSSEDLDKGAHAGPIDILRNFSEDASKASQWRVYLRNNRLDDAPGELKEAVKAITEYLGPITMALAGGRTFNRTWKAPGPWK